MHVACEYFASFCFPFSDPLAYTVVHSFEQPAKHLNVKVLLKYSACLRVQCILKAYIHLNTEVE